MHLNLNISGLTTGRRLHRTKAESLFPFGLEQAGLHEIVEAEHGDLGAATGFLLATAQTYGGLSKGGHGAVLWVAQHKSRQVHGRLLQSAARLGRPCLGVSVRKSSDALWAAEEALSTSTTRLIIAELEDADFTATRRLKLAAERHGGHVVLLMPYQREGASACETRWRVSAAPSAQNVMDKAAPGSARWRVRLERCRALPDRVGEEFILEYDDKTLSLRVVPQLADGAVASPEKGAGDMSGQVIEANFRSAG